MWTSEPRITHFILWTWVTLPALSNAIEEREEESDAPRHSRRASCLPRSSFDRDEDMILRRTDEGASKCALRVLRREEETSA